MFWRLALCSTALALGACDGGGAEAVATKAVECSLSGAAGFVADCTMERQELEGDKFLILRHPDGSFRRFQLGVEGRGSITADGMEQAEVEQSGGHVEVRVGPDRYRLPIAQ